MPDDRDRGRDLVLAPNEFAFISDETKGNINVYVGPHKTSLANTDRPVVFNYGTKRFDRCSLEQATQTLAVAPEGWYLILKNPAKDASHPRTGALNNLPDLQIGRKVNVPGPVSFALWPGQMAKVVQGHHIRSNQYLLVRVYDEEGAKANFQHAVFRGRDGDDSNPAIRPEDLSMGRKLIIQGTEVAFHIPPTGIEVLADENNEYVREAVTLERLEYCILLDEEGNKRFVRGPAVVFPRPTEVFVERQGSRKFRAIELNEHSGIYVKVIAPYALPAAQPAAQPAGAEGEGEAQKIYKVGDELFVTGREQMIYYPRPEHAIIKYSDQEIHYAIAIPAGEGRYVLDRDTGQITLQRGPSMFLPDPRRQVIVRRVLDTRTVQLWFPGNQEALAVNQKLAEARAQETAEPQAAAQKLEARQTQNVIAKPAAGFAGDDFNRRQSFTAPRTITLDTRYEGAVVISVWTGYAVMVVNRQGERRVIAGPHTHLLEYDETLQVLELSTGTPKTDQNLYRTVYLRVLNNKISDTVEAETRDLCRVRLSLSYRVNFEEDPEEYETNERWFNVENYVKFLTDHLRSLIRHVVKQHGVEHFYANNVSILRDTILGASQDGKRVGRAFAENGMRVYDVEILDVTIGDEKIAQLLIGAQHAAVQQALSISGERRRLELAQEVEGTRQRVDELTAASRLNSLSIQAREAQARQEQALANARAELALKQLQQQAQQAEQGALDDIHQHDLSRRRAAAELEAGIARQQLEARIEELRAQVEATVARAGAVSPDLVAALQAFSDRALTERVAQSMAPLAILGGESVAEVLSRLLQGTPLARLIAPPPAPEAANKTEAP